MSDGARPYPRATRSNLAVTASDVAGDADGALTKGILITVMSLVGTTFGSTMATSLIYDRFVETPIGLVVGVPVALVYSATQCRDYV